MTNQHGSDSAPRVLQRTQHKRSKTGLSGARGRLGRRARRGISTLEVAVALFVAGGAAVGATAIMSSAIATRTEMRVREDAETVVADLVEVISTVDYQDLLDGTWVVPYRCDEHSSVAGPDADSCVPFYNSELRVGWDVAFNSSNPDLVELTGVATTRAGDVTVARLIPSDQDR